MSLTTRRGIRRRDLLIGGLRVSALVPLASELALARRLDGDDRDDRVLVVLQLTGGNDGLNTVVPHRQDAYYRLRPNVAQPRGALHRLDDDHGLHPAMGGLGELFAEGRVAIAHGVGHGDPDRSHFRSLQIWHSAKADGPPGEVGWLGRLADQIAQRSPGTMPAMAIEAGDLPLSMRGLQILPPTVRDPRGFRLHEKSERIGSLRDDLAAPAAEGDLGFLREAARTTYATALRMAEVADAPGAGDYPGTDLAQRFRLVAQLVRGGFGTRIFHLSLGGFDTHARQAPVHADRLTQVSGALTAFQRDLESHGAADRVVTLVFSEFGRRAKENGSMGTDHGRGAPLLLVGTRVRGGLSGTAPDLECLVEGDVPPTTDFRSVYATLERDWMGFEASTPAKPVELLNA